MVEWQFLNRNSLQWHIIILYFIYYILFPVGTAGIILQAPSLYDLRPAIDEYLSEIEVAAKPLGLSDNLYI